MKRKIVYPLLLLAIISLVCLVANRNRDRIIGEVYPGLEAAASCKIVTMTAACAHEKTLQGGELDTFLERLSQTPCRSEGMAGGDTYEGQLYHLYLFANSGEMEPIYITTNGYLRIGFRGYSLLSKEFIQYLDHILTS